MLSKTLFSALVASLLAAAAFAEITKENGVLVLTDDNFDEALDKYPGLLVEMYAPWCGHCKNLQPAYDAAAAELEKQGLPLAKIDAAEHKESAAKYGVQGFPTIKYFSNGKNIDYQGGRTTEDIVAFVVKKSGPPAVDLDSEKAIEEFKTKGDVVVVGFYSDDAAAKAFLQAASENDNQPFGIVKDAKVAKALGASDNSIVVFKTFDEGKADASSEDAEDAESIAKFVGGASQRLLTTFSDETSRAIFGGPVQVHVLFFAKELSSELQSIAEEAAKKQRGTLLHVHIPASESRVTEYFGITEADMPTIMIADMTKAVKKYSFGKKEITQESLEAFEKAFLNGELSPELKSEEVEDADTEGPVKIVKGKSFADIVLNTKKDVFVKMHAPWCGHCKSLAPKWDELAEALADNDNVVIAKMDATANEIDVEGAEVEGFPTLFFFSGSDKSSPIKYEGAREVEDMMKFIEENSASDSDGKDEL